MAEQPTIIDPEEWRDIPGWEGIYQASSLGRIKSVKRVMRRRGMKPSVLPETIMTQQIDRLGYRYVKFRRYMLEKRYAVARLVCLTFNGPPPRADMVAAHGDGNPPNNVPGNLRWATQKENMADAQKHGTIKNRHNGHASLKFSADMLHAALTDFSMGMDRKAVAQKYGMSARTSYRLLK